MGREVSVKNAFGWLTASLVGTSLGMGCVDNTPAPPSAAVPPPSQAAAPLSQSDGKPLPTPQAQELPPPAFDDSPLVDQRAPEERAFVAAYQQVGRPRILILVNPTPDPQLAGIDDGVEKILADWLGADGQVDLVSPLTARQHPTDSQIKDLQSGHAAAPRETPGQPNADIFVQVQVHPIEQTPNGLAVRMTAEAINVKGGESIGRAVVDVPPPLGKPQINTYTRYMARKLMDGMIGSWEANGGQAPPAGSAGPSTQPVR